MDREALKGQIAQDLLKIQAVFFRPGPPLRGHSPPSFSGGAFSVAEGSKEELNQERV